MDKKIPEPPKNDNKTGFKGGVIQGFPTTKGATPNEFCSECGCKVGGKFPSKHCGNPCGSKR